MYDFINKKSIQNKEIAILLTWLKNDFVNKLLTSFKKEDFYKITEDLKTLNQEKRSIESDIALSKLEIKDLKYDLEKKKNIILDKEGYLKTLKEMEIILFVLKK